MPIGGFVRTSFVDYPGKIATTVFLTKCNFYCPFCQNPELVLDSGLTYTSFDTIIKFLTEARHMIDAVCFSGGEPTLDPELPNYIARAKALGMLVKLDTNGANPDILKTLPVDYIAMDLKTSPDRYPMLTRIPNITEKITQSIRLIRNELNVDYEFRTTLAPEFLDNIDIQALGPLIQGSPRWFLQKFRNTRCLDPQFQQLSPLTNDQMNHLLTLAKTYVPSAILR